MAGIIIGGGFGLLLIGVASSGEIYEDSPSQLMLLALAIGIGGLLLGLVFKRTVGIAAFGLMVGGVVAAVIMLVRLEFLYAWAMGIYAAVGAALQQTQAQRLEREGLRSPPRG